MGSQPPQVTVLAGELLRESLHFLTTEKTLHAHTALAEYFATMLMKDLEVCGSGAEQATADMEKIAEESSTSHGEHHDDDDDEDDEHDDDPIALSISLHTDQTAIKLALTGAEQALAQLKVRECE